MLSLFNSLTIKKRFVNLTVILSNFSAVVEVAGRMSIDAVYAEAGVLLNTSMYTSTQINGNGTYKQGQILKFEIGAPTKPVQIFNVS